MSASRTVKTIIAIGVMASALAALAPAVGSAATAGRGTAGGAGQSAGGAGAGAGPSGGGGGTSGGAAGGNDRTVDAVIADVIPPQRRRPPTPLLLPPTPEHPRGLCEIEERLTGWGDRVAVRICHPLANADRE